jgi:hypothetical protein
LFIDEILRTSSIFNKERKIRGRATNYEQRLNCKLDCVLCGDLYVRLSHHTFDIYY